ncbi:MAG: hypothetical protein ACKO0V_19680 [bacterium]
MQTIINKLLQSPLFRLVYWFIRAPFSCYAAFAFYKEKTARDLRTNGEYRVRFGPYKGLKYLKHGSSISLNCLLGSYEMEIWPVLESVKNENYELIIDVGCAEGYHACGLAMITGKLVLAYDTSEIARDDCRLMAKVNGLADQIQVGDYLSAEKLNSICSEKKVFLFCDIDYHEMQLLDLQKASSLEFTDILVETHGRGPGSEDDTLPLLLSRFSETHEIQIYTMNARLPYELWQFVDKSDDYRFAIGKVIDEPLCHAFFEERGWNNWLWMRSRKNLVE